MDFCIVRDGEIRVVATTSNPEQFPIYRNLSVLPFDIIHRNNIPPYPVSV